MTTEPQARVIKIIYPHKCPHCSKDILLSVRMLTPGVDWVLRKEDIEMAKDKVRKAIEESKIDATEKATVLKWVNNEETLFGPEEVQQIIEQVVNNQNDNTEGTSIE